MLWPPVHDQIIELAARAGSRYLALQTRSAILTWDLGDVVPELVASDANDTWIFDDGMAIVSNLVSCDWLDLATGFARGSRRHGGVTAQIAAPPTGRQLLDLVNGTRWRVASQDPVKSISMTGRTGLLFAAGRVSVVHFDVPDDPEKIREWVLQATNHTLDAAGP